MTQIRIERYDPETGTHTIHKVTIKPTRSGNIGFKTDHNDAVCRMIINNLNEVMALVKPYTSKFNQTTGTRTSTKGTWTKVGRYEEYSGLGGVAFLGPVDVLCLWGKAGRQTVQEFMEMYDK